jgi:hypothetical protein
MTTLPKRATFSAACFRQADEQHEEARGNSEPDYVCADFDNDGCKGSKRQHPRFSLPKLICNNPQRQDNGIPSYNACCIQSETIAVIAVTRLPAVTGRASTGAIIVVLCFARNGKHQWHCIYRQPYS